jgi:glyoxylase-like metal-dependent hydrolase (beta-lactamase superfamily II)
MPALRPLEGVWASGGEDLIGAAVAPGVWATALPFPNPLKSSFSYLVETSNGLIVVDLGWNSDESWQVFLAGLAKAGKSLDDISGVVITHLHPDHYGLASRIRENSSAWIGAHPAEHPQLAVDAAGVERRVEEMVGWLRLCGAPESEIDQLRSESAEIATNVAKVQPDVDLEDAAEVRGVEGLTVVHTPGHTPGHLCFLDRGRNLLFTGDHVLPRVTPNISKRPTSGQDPLADFTHSLQRLKPLDRGNLLALPGHEWGFDGLRGRIAEIDGHHVARLDEIEDAVSRGATTAWEVAEAVHWSRPFETLVSRARRSAIGETYSHLFRLHALGRIQLVDGPPERWIPTRAPLAR